MFNTQTLYTCTMYGPLWEGQNIHPKDHEIYNSFRSLPVQHYHALDFYTYVQF
jgi:hypothetical protein